MFWKTNASEKAAHKVDVRGLENDLKAKVDGEVRFDRGTRALYATDGSNYRQVPIGVVIPHNRAAVIAAVKLCHDYGAPILSRGCGTSLAGQCCNVAVVIDHSKYRHHILEVDANHKTALVEPGVILDEFRHFTVDQYKLIYGPDPATHNHCTLGGMIGNNSCGIHSVMAGRTADNVHEMDILTYDGLELHVGPTSEQELEKIVAAGGRRGQIYQSLKGIRDKYADLIRARYPDIPRRVSGYNLDDLLPEKGFNVARALVGSESTCVHILEAKVRLVDYPPARALLALGYPDVYRAGDHVTQIMEYGPVGLEGVDDKLIEFMKIKHVHPQDVELLPEGGGWLLVEFGGETQEEADDQAHGCMNSLRKRKDAPSMKYFDKPKEEEKVWEIRESGLGSTAFVPGLPLAWPGWEDSAVPPDRVGDYLRDLRKLLDKHEYIASLYGHLGQGCIHCRITFDLFTRKGVENCLSFLDDATSLVVSYNGSLSGEHGDGQARAFFLPKMYGPELIRAFEEFKAIWDPQYLMNPGKVVNPYRPDENLRLGPRYRPWEPRTYFQFPQDQGSYSRAALRCVGVGKCRAVENTFMCPSFLVTREEKDTTRGRAHLLFEMCHKGIINSGWRSQAVNESLDLCLSCKACKLECPINVDMATLKAEFRAHHYRSRIKPRVYYSMGLIGTWARLGSKMPLLANFVSQIPGLRDLVKEVAGVAPQRKLPKFAHQTFGDWYRKNRDTSLQHRPQVVLFPDMFNNYFLPHTLEATYLLLNHWGYDVVLPSGELTDARPLIHYGWLKRAQKEIKLALGQLEPFLKEEIPVLFCEPSTASIFRDEAEEFFPKDENVKKMKSLALLPVVRRAPKDTYLVADGFSCRTQIEEGTGCKALHFAEFLLLAYQKNGIDIRLGRESGRQILERVEVV